MNSDQKSLIITIALCLLALAAGYYDLMRDDDEESEAIVRGMIQKASECK